MPIRQPATSSVCTSPLEEALTFSPTTTRCSSSVLASSWGGARDKPRWSVFLLTSN